MPDGEEDENLQKIPLDENAWSLQNLLANFFNMPIDLQKKILELLIQNLVTELTRNGKLEELLADTDQELDDHKQKYENLSQMLVEQQLQT